MFKHVNAVILVVLLNQSETFSFWKIGLCSCANLSKPAQLSDRVCTAALALSVVNWSWLAV